MFCVYKIENPIGWVAEFVVGGRAKITAYGKTPHEAVDKIFEMSGYDEESEAVLDESPVSPTDNGACAALPSNVEHGVDGPK